jgi:hypothetical protein
MAAGFDALKTSRFWLSVGAVPPPLAELIRQLIFLWPAES